MPASSAVSIAPPPTPTAAQVARVWAWGLSAAFLVGPIAAWLVARTAGPGGTDDAFGLASATPLLGAVLAILAMVLVAASGAAAARLGGQRMALFIAGLVAGWAAWAAGSNAGPAAHAGPVAMTLNGLGGGVAILLTGGWVLAMGRQRPDPAFFAPTPSAAEQLKVLAQPKGLVSIVIGAIVGGVIASWVLREPSAGQGFAAAWAGSLAAAVAVRFAGAAMQMTTSMMHCLAPAAVLCLVGSIMSWVSYSEPAEAVRAFAFGGLAGPTPAAWLAGALLGAPLGARWFTGANASQA